MKTLNIENTMTTTNRASNHAIIQSLLVVACVVTASSSHAADVNVQEKLHALSALRGDAYIVARDAMVADASIHAALRQTVARASFRNETWRLEAQALAVVAHIDDENAGRALAELAGITPAVYQAARRPVPLVGREIVARNVNVGILIEEYVKTIELRPFTNVVVEEPALRRGLLMAVAKSGHAVALPFLSDVALRGASDDERATAASVLGSLGEKASPVLIELLATRQSREVRAATITGLGQTRSTRAVDELMSLASTTTVSDERHNAIRAIGSAGDRWAHAAAQNPQSDALREKCARALVTLLAAQPDGRAVEHVALALAVVAHPSTPTLLEKASSLSPTWAADKALVMRRVDRALARAQNAD